MFLTPNYLSLRPTLTNHENIKRYCNGKVAEPTSASPAIHCPTRGSVVDGSNAAQDFSMCRWAVGVRMRKPSEAGVIEALNKGDIIRSHLNRSTWQLVTKEDYHWMMPLHRERSIRSWCAFAKQSGNPISDKMMDNSRELLTNILGGKKASDTRRYHTFLSGNRHRQCSHRPPPVGSGRGGRHHP